MKVILDNVRIMEKNVQEYKTSDGKNGFKFILVAYSPGGVVDKITVPKEIYDTMEVNSVVDLLCNIYINYQYKFYNLYIK